MPSVRSNPFSPLHFLTLFAAAVCGSVWCGCRLDESASRTDLVATTDMVGDLTSQVVGNRGHVSRLMGAGIDPHTYKPTRNGVRQLLDARLIIYSGLGLEHRMQQTIEQLARSGKPTIAVTAGLTPEQLRYPEGAAGQVDPHVWMDPVLWRDCVGTVATALAENDPVHALEFETRAGAYREQLDALHGYVSRIIGSIPEERRVLVTAHDAFGYFAQRYGLEVHSVQGVSTESEAGVNDVNALVDFLVERKIPAIFIETSVNPKPIEAVLEGCRSRGWSVAIGGELYSDAMGPAGTYEGTYLGMIDANATAIARALGGDAPARGWQGRLHGADKVPSQEEATPAH